MQALRYNPTDFPDECANNGGIEYVTMNHYNAMIVKACKDGNALIAANRQEAHDQAVEDLEIEMLAREESVQASVKQHIKDIINDQMKLCDTLAAHQLVDDPDRMKGLMKELNDYDCDLCHMPGHRRSHCWFNYQLYTHCQRNKVTMLMYAQYRAGLKCHLIGAGVETVAMLALEQKKAAIEATRQSKKALAVAKIEAKHGKP